MKRFGLCVMLVVGLTLVGCEDRKQAAGTADSSQAKATEASLAEANRQIGMPSIVNFQERKLAKMIFELRDQEDFVCYAYYFNALDGKRGDFIGKCLGYGLPYSVQFTNPEKIAHEVRNTQGSSFGTLPQADPNGLFMPTSSSATWLMLLDDKGEAHPVYMEPLIIVSPFKLHEETK